MLAPVALILALVICAGLRTAPPSDEQVQQTIDAYLEARDTLFKSGLAMLEGVTDLYRHALDDLSVNELSVAQVAMLYRANMLRDQNIRGDIIARIEPFIDDSSTSGVMARLLRLALVGGVVDPDHRPEPALQVELTGAVFAHPALSEAIRNGDAGFVIEAINATAKKSVWRKYKEQIYGLSDDIMACTDHRIAFSCETYYNILGYINEEGGTEEDDARRQAIRADLVVFGRAVLDRADAGEIVIREKRRTLFEGALARLDSAHAKGTFIGSEAPRLDFIWSSDKTMNDLNALKGQVVILDFWATWCGPCVASIPDVRKLQARYEGYPVKIIGVTSIQGNHVNDDGSIDCTDDPDKEMGLMAEYIGRKEISWTIAFTEQPVYNPEYGVGGIPHMTILAPDGTVRHNGLHPSAPLHEKVKLIDTLLVEFNLPAPSTLINEASQSDK